MNKTTIILVLLIMGFFLVGCTSAVKTTDKTDSYYGNDLSVYTLCADGVVCYHHSESYGASGSCFRDKDLVDKYCKQ